MSDFLQDTLKGLSASPKYLDSKYFYDETGDEIFREIMECPEYYLTRCELEILTDKKQALSHAIVSHLSNFDVVELGPGDGSKSIHLLNELGKQNNNFTYYPIDISANVVNNLVAELPGKIPGVKIIGLNGDYFEMLGKLKGFSNKNKVVLFLGSSIGNVPIEENANFFKKLRSYLLPGDLLLTGFDLQKDAQIILDAYNDKGNITKRFNINLLHRINTTLAANFDLTQFEHTPEYNIQSGACKSYLTSLTEQVVRVDNHKCFPFKAGEKIYMEISQKYTVAQIQQIAIDSGFQLLENFYDSKKWFVDTLWQYPNY